MCKRLLALFLACVLLWSGATAHESLLMPVAHDATTATPLNAAAVPATDPGSVADHHLDDQPAQALGDAPTDTPALPPSAPGLPPSPTLPAAGAPHRAAAWATHVPEGPLRPPRPAARAATRTIA
tara:strand:- start:285 stop:659 length:375 start_codon:yes stop_codon:yes gene_type:complete